MTDSKLSRLSLNGAAGHSKLHRREWAHLHRQWPLTSWASGHSRALVGLRAARALGIGMLLAAGVCVAPAPAIDGHNLQPVSHSGSLRVLS